LIPGTLLVVAIGWLTNATLARGLVAGSEAVGAKSYGALAGAVLGRRVEWALQLSVFIKWVGVHV
jgi:hypothetical protein